MTSRADVGPAEAGPNVLRQRVLGSTHLPLEGVGQLHEELAIQRRELLAIGELAVVAVADEHHRLPVELVGEQRRSAEFSFARCRVGGREERIAAGGHVLHDDARKEARRKGVGAAQTGDALRQKRPLPPVGVSTFRNLWFRMIASSRWSVGWSVAFRFTVAPRAGRAWAKSIYLPAVPSTPMRDTIRDGLNCAT